MAQKDIVTVLKKKRTQLRTSVTKLVKTIEEEIEIEKDNVTYEEVEVKIEFLKDKFHLLSTTDDELIKYFQSEEEDREFNSSQEIIEINELVVQNLMDFLAKELYSREKSERQLSGAWGNSRLVRNYDPGTSYETPLVNPSTAEALINQPRKSERDSPETVCLPDSDVAVTPKVPVDAAIVRIPDENESPVVHAGEAINEQGETIMDSSPSITPNDPVPASPLTFPDDPEPEEGDLGDSTPDKRTTKTRFGRL
ncbi:hypothetical protein TNIN_140601 [Trichonephila inaurata madagascariensis]|uniref:Uncharacterized protein n=1 Tax=Trichonephila inaurata madagascariensis TaxID=2747483 RepID=A0A8X6X8D3_9ARAC|nr:hypothetical protein TNIN_180021 [Trichonephila inaurata madagascariensis]GFY64228.1 hypothetical protein TNIN_140601 [Trichonephila inaurata madagascariensis]